MKMSGQPSTSASNSGKGKEPAEPPRFWYSKNSAEEFNKQLNDVFDSMRQQNMEIKEAIENGAYDTDEKLEAALERMFDSLGIDLDDE